MLLYRVSSELDTNKVPESVGKCNGTCCLYYSWHRFVLHGAFGLKGVGHLIEGFNLAKSRQEALQVSLVAAISFAITMVAWGWGTTLFSREALGLVVAFGPLFLVEVALFFLAPQFFIRFSKIVVHGVKAGIGVAIPVGTLYYMMYMFYVGH